MSTIASEIAFQNNGKQSAANYQQWHPRPEPGTAQSRKPAMNSKRWDRRLFVRCSPDLTEEELLAMLEKFGKIVNFALLRDSNGASKGSAYVTYGKLKSADTAKTNLHGKNVGGKMMYVQKADKPDTSSSQSVDTPAGSRMFVVGPKTMTEEELHAWFNKFGHIEHIVVLKDSALRQASGAAFVKFSEAYMATAAIAASSLFPYPSAGNVYQCRVANPRHSQSHGNGNRGFDQSQFSEQYRDAHAQSERSSHILQELGITGSPQNWSTSPNAQTPSAHAPCDPFEQAQCPTVLNTVPHPQRPHGNHMQRKHNGNLMVYVGSTPSTPSTPDAGVQHISPNTAPTPEVYHHDHTQYPYNPHMVMHQYPSEAETQHKFIHQRPAPVEICPHAVPCTPVYQTPLQMLQTPQTDSYCQEWVAQGRLVDSTDSHVAHRTQSDVAACYASRHLPYQQGYDYNSSPAYPYQPQSVNSNSTYSPEYNNNVQYNTPGTECDGYSSDASDSQSSDSFTATAIAGSNLPSPGVVHDPYGPLPEASPKHIVSSLPQFAPYPSRVEESRPLPPMLQHPQTVYKGNYSADSYGNYPGYSYDQQRFPQHQN